MNTPKPTEPNNTASAKTSFSRCTADRQNVAYSIKVGQLRDLPVEMLDWILVKALYFSEYYWVKTKQYVSNNALLRIIARLQSVTSAWTDRLNTNWFRIVFKRRRKGIESALSSCPVFVSREEWSARDPISKTPLYEPVPMVVILEIIDPFECHELDECYDEISCTQAVQYKQEYCMENKCWADIGYNFLIGEDGRVYEGRGWKVTGAHTFSYNDSSIGISFIGIFETRAPSDVALRATHELIRLGVKEGHIARDYTLHGHRDLRPTSRIPGKYLHEIIKGWPNYKSTDL